MQVLSQSAFLQALGYAIASSLWQAALVWILVAVANGLFKFSSQVKYRIALVAQFSIFIWFIFTLQFYFAKCSEAIAQMQYSGLNNGNAYILQPGMHSFPAAMLSAILKGEKLLPYLSIAYLCLLTLLAIRWIKGYRQTQLIKTQGLTKIDVDWRLFVKRISELLGIKQPVSIYVSELVKSPLTIGFLKPLILVPLASINNLTTDQLEAVILHELAHIKRADYLFNIIQSIIEITLFFNPFTQLISKIIKRERENSCDDWVLQFQYEPTMYAEALLRIASMQHNPAFAMNAAGNKDHDLLWRVKRMLNQQERSFQYRNRLFALVLITGVFSSLAWFHPTVKAESGQAAALQTQPVVVEPLAVKVDNPLYNPMFFFNGSLKQEVVKAGEDAKTSMQLQLAKANFALSKVAPAVINNIKTFNVDFPGIMNQAGDEVNAELAKMKMPENIFAGDKSGDSVKAKDFLVNTMKLAFKKVDWKKVNSDVAAAQDDVNKKLMNLNLGGISTVYIKNIVNNSLVLAQKSLSNLSSDSNNNDGDNSTPEITTGNGLIINAPKANRTREHAHSSIFQVRKLTDSLHKAYSITNSKDEGEYYYNTATQSVEPFYTQAYSANTYFPAKYDINSQVNLSVAATNDVSVSTKGTSTLIAVKEDAENGNSYKKRISIETLDSNGQRHLFHVTIEVYQ